MKAGPFDFPPAVLDYMSAGDPDLGAKRINFYAERIVREFAQIEPYLPSRAASFVDIGSGVAAIDILVAKHMAAHTVHLVDGDGTNDRKVSFGDHVKAWANVEIGAAMVRANTGPISIVTHPAEPDALLGIRARLVLSLKSWGHHYPIETYLQKIKGILLSAHPGALILDIRNGTDGREKLEASGFRFVAQCGETPKCKRLVFSI